MKNPITKQTSKLEHDFMALHTGNEQAKKWFAQSVQKILESNIDSYSKCDAIAEVFTSIDAKLTYIKEQQSLLSHLKKQLEVAKSYAKEEVSKSFSTYGVSKLEGLRVSSITVSKESIKQVSKLEIYNEEELLKLGYFSVVLDEKAVKEALLSADTRTEVQEFADIKINQEMRPASLRINKRKSFVQDDSVNLAA